MTETIVPKQQTTAAPDSADFLARIGRKGLLDSLKKLQTGRLTIIDQDGKHVFGETTGQPVFDVVITVHHSRFYSAIAFEGTVGAGQAFIDGDWECSDLTALSRMLVRNREALEGFRKGFAVVAMPMLKFYHRMRKNTKEGSRKNIAAHYDLGNDLYRLFLDETMTYSAAFFESEDTPLYDASVAKLDRLCRKLDLRQQDRVVEIGTGWGSFAIHAAKNYGCHVTTTTISSQQYDYAKEAITREGLEDRITLLFDDYRDLTGTFDKAVSIEMIEAVGWQYYETYFEKVGQLLSPEGAFAMQAITIRDQEYEEARKSVDFIQKFIFPGCCIPSNRALLEACEKASDFVLVDHEDITPHYAKTLRTWRERFFEQEEAVRELGYSDEFIRMWEFYLCYCEAGFAERNIGSVQMVFGKPRCENPVVRLN